MAEPLVPAHADLRDFHFMPLDVARLINSDLAAIATGEEFKAAVLLWCKCWHQVPASSLPNDERMLAHLAGYGRDLRGWKRVKDVALRGFILCADGRLYHPVIAEKVIEALAAKEKQRARTSNATRARLSRSAQRDVIHGVNRDDKRDEKRDDQRNVDRNVHQGTGTGTGTGTEKNGVVVARARDPDLETRLREAARWQSEPHPNLAITGQIEALIDAGADLEADVLPVVRALAPQARTKTSWKYFVSAIARARDDRIAAANIVTEPTGSPPHEPRPASGTIEAVFSALGGQHGEGHPPVRDAAARR